MPRTTLERIADREQAAAATAEQIRDQIEQPSARLAQIDAELADLATARKVVLALGEDEPTPTQLPGLPDNPAYQHIHAAQSDADRPLRCKDLCHALDEGTEPSRIEGMRSKLKRLVAVGLIAEQTPGLFAIPRPRTGD
jgi:hypothetical protein